MRKSGLPKDYPTSEAAMWLSACVYTLVIGKWKNPVYSNLGTLVDGSVKSGGSLSAFSKISVHRSQLLRIPDTPVALS